MLKQLVKILLGSVKVVVPDSIERDNGNNRSEWFKKTITAIPKGAQILDRCLGVLNKLANYAELGLRQNLEQADTKSHELLRYGHHIVARRINCPSHEYITLR